MCVYKKKHFFWYNFRCDLFILKWKQSMNVHFSKLFVYVSHFVCVFLNAAFKGTSQDNLLYPCEYVSLFKNKSTLCECILNLLFLPFNYGKTKFATNTPIKINTLTIKQFFFYFLFVWKLFLYLNFKDFYKVL